MNTTQTSATSNSVTRLRPAVLDWWQALGLAAVGATVVNLGVLGVAALAGASLELTDRGAVHAITAGGVIFSSVVPLLVGAALAVLLARWWAPVLRAAQVVGGGLALVSVAGPLLADTDGGTRAALALMHIVVGVAVVVGLESVRRSRT